ncbi:hypothetical protein [Streptomyces sp. NPDC059850]|uniref:hypothetical protein n=1 Tax=Streptomyces sp. NPDC059850 TaxID=3346970 RepID=UPI00365B1CB7
MAMMTQPDGQWLDRALQFAGLTWTYPPYEALFVRNGWHLSGPDGEPVIHEMEIWPPPGEDHDEGWHLWIGNHPGCEEDGAEVACAHAACREDRGVLMPLAYSAFEVCEPDGTSLPPEEVWEFGAFTGWRWRPEATEDDWASAYRAAEELLRTRLGEPVPRPPDEALDAERGVVWAYGDSVVTLFEGPELLSDGQYDWICVEVSPRRTP